MNGIEGGVGILKLSTAIGCGLMAGVFFAFSTLVMDGLARLDPRHATEAMQSINVAAVQSIFIAGFMGTALLCLITGIAAFVHRQQPGSMLILAGCAAYLIGSMLVTMICNVPLNDALAAAHTPDTSTDALWRQYLSTWTAWNHVRTVSSTAAMVLLIVGMCRGGAAT